MKPLERSNDAFLFLTERRGLDGDGETDAIGLFTYALVERERIEWETHRASQGLPPPDSPETRAWFADKPETYFTDKLRRGEEWFADFARAYLKDEIEADRERTVQDAVAGLRTDIASSQSAITGHIDIRTKGKGWGVNITSGLVANFIFAFIVAVLFFVAANRLSLGDIIADIARGRVEPVK